MQGLGSPGRRRIGSELLLQVFPGLQFSYWGHSLLITDDQGRIGTGLTGLYEHDLRLLATYRLSVNGEEPRLDVLSAVHPHSSLGYYVCAPTPGRGEVDALGLSKDEQDREVVLELERFVGRGLHEDLQVTNFSQDPAELLIGWDVSIDFADLIEMRGGQRQQEAPVSSEWASVGAQIGELRFDYRHPQLSRGAILRFELQPTGPDIRDNRTAGHTPGGGFQWDGQRVTYRLLLAPRESRHFCLTISGVVDGQIQPTAFTCGGQEQATDASPTPHGRLANEATRLRTPHPIVQRAWDRAVLDLDALALGDGEHPAERMVPSAGIPLYGTLFGRDTLTVGLQSLMASPSLAEGAIRLLSRHLGTREDDFYDEEPGRVPQQVRDDPLAILGLTPWQNDYGDYAAPCDFLILLGAHHLAVGNAELTRELLDPALHVLGWLQERADRDGDGFLEYQTRSPRGQRHQGWKDAGNAVVDAQGRQVEPPVAPCEIQGYWYAAQLLMAEVFLALGMPARAFELFRSAQDLQQRFNESFWMPEEQYVAFGLDAEKRQIRSVVSNPAHCLATGIVSTEHAPAVVRRLLAPDLFSGWGIRTLSADHPAFNPLKYHLGTVWPVENATAAFGMKRYGFASECNRLAEAIFDAAALFEHVRLPECFGGFARDERHAHPGIYPDACAPQAWSASAVFWLVQAMLGLWAYAPLKALIVDPELPEWLPELTLLDVHIAEARVSLQFKRDAGGHTDYRILEQEGTLHVLRQPVPNASVSPLHRLRDLVESLLPGH
jgi:glycogen debranching enzyme